MANVYQAECRECDWRSEFTDSWKVADNWALGHELGMKHYVRVVEQPQEVTQ